MEQDPSANEARLHLVGPDWAPQAAGQGERTATREEEPLLWRGRPSIVGAAGSCLKVGVLLGVAMALAHGWAPWGWRPPARPAWLSPWLIDVRVWSACAFAWCGSVALELAALRYELTPECLRVTRGVLQRRTVEWPLRLVGDIAVVQPWFARPAGRADVVLYLEGLWRRCETCGTRKTLPLVLRCVKDPAWLRQTFHALARSARG
jgi:uncharacterized membrane protein YdbT with pleckstrin-like domain